MRFPTTSHQQSAPTPPSRSSYHSLVQNELNDLRQKGLTKKHNKHFTLESERLREERREAEDALREIVRRKAEIAANPKLYKSSRGLNDGMTLTQLDALHAELQLKKQEVERREKELSMQLHDSCGKEDVEDVSAAILPTTSFTTRNDVSRETVPLLDDEDDDDLSFEEWLDETEESEGFFQNSSSEMHTIQEEDEENEEDEEEQERTENDLSEEESTEEANQQSSGNEDDGNDLGFGDEMELMVQQQSKLINRMDDLYETIEVEKEKAVELSTKLTQEMIEKDRLKEQYENEMAKLISTHENHVNQLLAEKKKLMQEEEANKEVLAKYSTLISQKDVEQAMLEEEMISNFNQQVAEMKAAHEAQVAALTKGSNLKVESFEEHNNRVEEMGRQHNIEMKQLQERIENEKDKILEELNSRLVEEIKEKRSLEEQYEEEIEKLKESNELVMEMLRKEKIKKLEEEKSSNDLIEKHKEMKEELAKEHEKQKLELQREHERKMAEVEKLRSDLAGTMKALDSKTNIDGHELPEEIRVQDSHKSTAMSLNDELRALKDWNSATSKSINVPSTESFTSHDDSQTDTEGQESHYVDDGDAVDDIEGIYYGSEDGSYYSQEESFYDSEEEELLNELQAIDPDYTDEDHLHFQDESNSYSSFHSPQSVIESHSAYSRRQMMGFYCSPQSKDSSLGAYDSLDINVLFLIPTTEKIRKMAHYFQMNIVDDPLDATHVIAGDAKHSLRRTAKLMTALCVTSNILKGEWLENSFKRRELLSCNRYLLLNDSKAEKNYSFSMRTTLREGRERRENGGLFYGWKIFVCEGVAGNKAPKEHELRAMIEAGGGIWLNSGDIPVPVMNDPNHVIVITSDPPYQYQIEDPHAEIAAENGAGFYTTSWLFDVLMHQKIFAIRRGLGR